MSLLVWLPFTNNNNNHGLGSTVTIAAAKGSLVDNGKLGKCFKTTTSGDISLIIKICLLVVGLNLINPKFRQ